MTPASMQRGDDVPLLMRPLTIRGVTAPNRVMISPMCMYSAPGGCVGDFHFTHLARFALGGAGIVFVEATAVTEQGRISHLDVGLYDDAQIEPLARISAYIRACGSVPAVQLGHAGRKASGQTVQDGAGPLGPDDAARGWDPWPTIGPSGIAAEGGWPVPTEMSTADIRRNIADWAEAARRAVKAGFHIVELHGGHGYLVHQFLSPFSNLRNDAYGGPLENRMRFALEVAEAVRAVIPDDMPLFFRVSALDGSGGGWTMDDTIALARELKARGVDAIDCSSGGMTSPSSTRQIPRSLGFQVPFAAQVKQRVGIATVAVGLILDGKQAEAILKDGDADIIAVARSALADPNWAQHAEHMLTGAFDSWPPQFKSWLERRQATLERMHEDFGEQS